MPGDEDFLRTFEGVKPNEKHSAVGDLDGCHSVLSAVLIAPPERGETGL